MKIVGLVAEYNPFHNGHVYHIEKTREVCGADYIIVVMSGDYVQRGTPALLDKYARAEMALWGGADLVIELPVFYASGSAEYFATGAVDLLNQLGVVDTLCFGSESGDIHMLAKIADSLNEETPEFKEKLKSLLKQGISYPAAREQALGSSDAQFFMPNNLLGIEYIRALRYLKSSIIPMTIQRKDSSYHDEALKHVLSSATAIRKALSSSTISSVKGYMPESAFSILTREYNNLGFMMTDDFTSCLFCTLYSLRKQDIPLHHFQDISPDLGDRIYREFDSCSSIHDLVMHLKTRQYTLTRIQRGLLHILLGLEQKNWREVLSDGSPLVPYARVLGFRKSSAKLLSSIKKNTSIPLLPKMADYENILSENALQLINQDIFASDLYRKMQEIKFHMSLPNEFTRGILIL